MTNELVTIEGAALTPAQMTILTQQTPPEAIRVRPGPGGKRLSYVEHSWVTQTLNEAFGWAWSWDIQEWRLLPADDPVEAFVLGRLTVHTSQADLVKTQFGSSAVKRDRQGKPLSIGDDLKAASSDALKKAASLLGLALDLYGSTPQPARQNGNGHRCNGRANGKTHANGTVFPSPTAAVDWALTQGCFNHRRHAENAYKKLKAEKNPASATEMSRLWRAEVAQRVAAKGDDEPAKPPF